MSYALYDRKGSGGFVVEAALTLAGAPFELDSKPGTPLPESFRETNPWRQLPTLILPDGTVMTETSAILVHLALSSGSVATFGAEVVNWPAHGGHGFGGP